MSKVEFTSKGMLGSSQIAGYPRLGIGLIKKCYTSIIFTIACHLGSDIR